MLSKHFRVLLVLFTALSLHADTQIVNDISWTYSISNGCAIIGTGTKFSSAIPTSTSGTVSIPSVLGNCPVIGVDDYAFYRCAVASVIIPHGVTRIGKDAFALSDLATVTIPNTVTTIGEEAFAQCSKLTFVVIPDGVTTISRATFFLCNELTSVSIPSHLKSILKDAFAGCNKLSSAIDLTNVTEIGEFAFSECKGLSSVVLSEQLLSIGTFAFNKCMSLTSVRIPEGVTNIGTYAFQDCTKLASVELPSTLVDIKQSTFMRCTDLKSVSMPVGIMNIGAATFAGCTGLQSLSIPSSVTNIDACAFSGCKGLTSLTVPPYVTNIGDEAFSDCNGLVVVTLPAGPTTIGTGVFDRCYGIHSITVPGWGCGIDLSTVTITNLVISDGTTEVKPYAFSWCTTLESVTIPSSVTNVGIGAFNNNHGIKSATVPGWDCKMDLASVENLVISEGTTAIRNEAFSKCKALKTLSIPSSVTSIGSSAFGYPESLSLSISDLEAWCNITFANNLWWNVDVLIVNGTVVSDLKIPDGTKSVMPYAFSGFKGIKTLTIPGSVTSIGAWAFYGCTEMSSAILPSSITNIAENAFAYCGLTAVTIPQGITSINEASFGWCSQLASVTIPNTVTNIGIGAFEFSGLKSLSLPSSVQRIGPYAFSGCSELSHVKIPTSVVYVDYDAFAGCYNIKDASVTGWSCGLPLQEVTNLVIEAGTTIISFPSCEYYGLCPSLQSVTIPSSVINIETNTFSAFTMLRNINVVAGDSLRIKEMLTASGFDASNLTFKEYDLFNGVTPIVIEDWVCSTLAVQFKRDDETASEYCNRFVAKYGDDYARAFLCDTGKVGSDNARLRVWHDYVAGTDPLDEQSHFKATIKIDGCGNITVDFNPKFINLSDASKRTYTLWGKKNLQDTNWTQISTGDESTYQFFRFTVEMKQ